MQVIQVRMGQLLIPVALHETNEPPDGFLSISYREFNPAGLTVSLDQVYKDFLKEQQQLSQKKAEPKAPLVPLPEQYRAKDEEEEEEEEDEISKMFREAAGGSGGGLWGLNETDKPKANIFIEGMGVSLPPNLQPPYNAGVMCRVRDGDYSEPKPSRTFKEIYQLIHPFHRVWLKPVWWIRKYFPTMNPYSDPLHTVSDKNKPWIWEGAIPFAIRAALNPVSAGLVDRRPLQIAFALHGEYGDDTWQYTKKLIEVAGEREVHGGFYDGENWITYEDAIDKEISLSVAQAGSVLDLPDQVPSRVKIEVLEKRYQELYAAYDPANVDAENDPVKWQQYVTFANHIQAAYYRLLIEKMLLRRRIASTAKLEQQLLPVVLSKLVDLDTSIIEQGVVRIVWNKLAPSRYHLKDKTIKYRYNEQEELTPVYVKDVLQELVYKLYLEPYIKKGYTFQVSVEGLPEEF